MPATFKSLNAVRTTLLNARDICTEPDVIAGLTEAVDELDVVIHDVMTADDERGDVTDQLTAHVTPEGEESDPSLPVPAIPAFDLNAEIRALFLSPTQMAVIA